MTSIFSFLTSSRKRAIWIALCWTLLILVACFIPGEDVPKVRIPFIDKWTHLIIFMGCGFFWSCVFAGSIVSRRGWVFVFSVFLGCLVELIQGSGLVRHRSFELNDMLADAAGALLGVVIFWLMERRYDKSPR
jgi:VanZ family protein